MLGQIYGFIVSNWVQWLFTGFFAISAVCYRKFMKALIADREKNKVIAEGLEALLRDRIIESYHKYEKSDKCPIYAKENVRRLYIPYHALGGNDVATELVNKLLEMPTT